MNHAVVVGRFQSLGDLARKLQRVIQWQRATFDAPAEVLAGHQLHGEKAHTVGFVHTEDRGDVGMVQRGKQLGLALEAGHTLLVLCEALGQNLDRHLAIEGGVHRLPHHTHPSLADPLDEAVVEQTAALFDGHGFPPPEAEDSTSICAVSN